jgi:folate-binding protein YgfZ
MWLQERIRQPTLGPQNPIRKNAVMTKNQTPVGQANQLIALPHYTLITVQGEDSEKFLQGQCTCDFTRLTTHEWLLGAHCNAQGRMHSSFYSASLSDGSIALRLHTSIKDSALAALSKYIVFSKADIKATEVAVYGLIVSEDTKIIPGTDAALPTLGHFSTPIEGLTILRLDEQRCELWINDKRLAAIIAAQCENGLSAKPQAWAIQNIQRGIAEVRVESAEKLIPQDLNFQLRNGIAFQKGCYTGQEIIARMHYKATLKKHLYRGTLKLPDDATPPAYGNSIMLTGASRSSGFVVDAGHLGDGHYEFLALVKDETTASENVILEVPSQPKITWLPLPYAIP